MIWLKKAKSILAAYASGDIGFVAENLSDDASYESSLVKFRGVEITDFLSLGTSKVSYQIDRSAYNDKTIFLEVWRVEKIGRKRSIASEVHVFEFNSHGKIKFWRVY